MKRKHSPRPFVDRAITVFLIAAVLVACLAFIIKFSGPRILQHYIESGMGNCEGSALLCLTADSEIVNPPVNADYIAGLAEYQLGEMEVRLPKEFIVVKESITKVYYKKRRYKHGGAVIYLTIQKPGFFINLFPQFKRQGINSDYDFISRIMCARLPDIRNLQDAFFVIMKGIFTPDVGDQKSARISRFILGKKRGFITCNFTDSSNYFDCNFVDSHGNYFKIYIKDKNRVLDLDKVLAIVSTVNKRGHG